MRDLMRRLDRLEASDQPLRVPHVWREIGETDEQALARCGMTEADNVVVIGWQDEAAR